jgi:molybdopterin-biosynthesis enzyme MoeA-like protein
LKGIFTEFVLPMLGVEVPEERCAVVVRGMGESELATYLNRVMAETGVEIRSYPSHRKIRLKILGLEYPRAIDLLTELLAGSAKVVDDTKAPKKD